MALAKAIVTIRGQGVHGVVRLQQPGNSAAVTVSGRISGLTPGSHGLRVLLFGDDSDGFANFGGIYNPFGKMHGDRASDDRPIGALGNIVADESGVANFEFTDSQLKLFGPLSVLGRALAVTEREDDCGTGSAPTSSTDGNAGAIIAGGVIGIAALGPAS